MSTNWETNPTDFVIRLLPKYKSDLTIRNYAKFQGKDISLERIAELRAKLPQAKVLDPGEPIGPNKRDKSIRENIVKASTGLAQAIGARS